MAVKKKFLYKVYAPNGTTFITTWENVINDPTFYSQLNAGFSELTVKLAHTIFNFGEGLDVAYGNVVKVYAFDGEAPNGVCIYSGYISRYIPVIDGTQESIEITLVSWWYQANLYLLEGTGSGVDSASLGNGYAADATPTMTSNVLPSPYVVAASSFLAAYDPWKAFDKNNTTEWATATGTLTGWLSFDFSVRKQVMQYTVVAITGAELQAPQAWTFEGSNDNANWTILDTQTNQTAWIGGTKRVFPMPNQTSRYRYYRINVSLNCGNSSNLCIGSLEIMEGGAYTRNGATTLNYNELDPSAILLDVIGKFNGQGGKLTASGATVDNTGITVTNQFNTNTIQEVINQLQSMSPLNWFFRVGTDDKIYFKLLASTPVHKFYLGRNVTYYKQEKRLENIVNYIYFTGSNFFKKYINSGSVAAYGRFTQKMVQQQVTDIATADVMANAILNRMSSPEIRIVLRVSDSNNDDGKGYDIESINVGDSCQIFGVASKSNNLWDNSLWDTDAWDYAVTNSAGTVLQIQKITYYPDYAELEISNRQPDIAKRVEDINKSLITWQTRQNKPIPLT